MARTSDARLVGRARRAALGALTITVLVGVASAQQAHHRGGGTPIQDAGVLHLSSRTWTPASEGHPNLGSTIYSNTALQPYYLSMDFPSREYGDYGRVPGTQSPPPEHGTEDVYRITGFQFAYCTRQPSSDFEYVVTFYDDYRPCDPTLTTMTEVAQFQLDGLPGSPNGQLRCWLVTVDLEGQEFELRADGGDGFDNFVVRDSFGWSVRNPSGGPSAGGPLLAGDPMGQWGAVDAYGDGTVWHCNAGAPGTGLGTEDSYWMRLASSDEPPTSCTTVMNVPVTYSSFHLELYADTSPPACGSTFGSVYCDPAAPNSSGRTGRMRATGSDVVADDVLTLWALGLPEQPNAGYFLMGRGQNTVVPPGSAGPICIAGEGIERILPGISNTSELPGGGFQRSVGTHGPVTGAITPGSSWSFQAWHRDGMHPSNFTNALRIEFQ